MPKKTMTFEQFMHAMNSHRAINGNHSKSVKKRGSIAKGDYQTGLFGGGQSPATQAAAQAAAQKAAQRAAEQAQRQADAQANQRATQARENQVKATQPAAQPAGNGAAAAAAAQATRPVYSAPTGNGAAAAAQLGATTDPEARRKARLQREALAQRQAAQRAAAAQAITSPTAQPTAQPNILSSLLNSAGNAITNAFTPSRRAHAAIPVGPGTATVQPPQPTGTMGATGTAQPTGTVGATVTPSNTPITPTWTNVPTEAPAATLTPVPPTATAAPPTLTNTPIPTATWALGAGNEAEAKLARLALGLGSSTNFSGDIDTIIRDMKGTVLPNPTAVTGPGGKGEYTLPFAAASSYSSDQIPPYIPLLNNADSINIANSLKTYENQRNPGSGVIDNNPGLPEVFGSLKELAANAYAHSPSSLAEVGRPEWATPGMQLDEKTITEIQAAAHNAANNARDAQTLGKQAYNNSIVALTKKIEEYNTGKATQQDVINAARFAQTSKDNKTLYDGRAAALTNAETLASKAYARIINKTDDLHLKREGYDYRYPKEATLEEPVVTNPITIGDGNSNSGDDNTIITQPTASGGKTVKTPVPTITQTPTSTPLKVSQSVFGSLSNPILTAQAEQGIRYEPDNGLAPYQQGGPGAFNPYDVGQPPSNYVKNRVMGNIVPTSYQPTQGVSPYLTPLTQTTQTTTPTPSNQPRTTPTQGMPSGMGTPSQTRTPTQQAIQITSTATPQKAPPSPSGNTAPAFGRGLGVGGGAGAMMGQSELVRAIQQLMGNQQTTQQQAISAYPQFATAQKRQKGKIKKDIGVGTGLTAHATQPVAESPMPRVHTSYGNYKFKKPSQENRSAKYGESQQLQQPVRKQIDAMQPMQPRQTMVNPMQYPPSRAPQHTLNPMPLDSNESMMFKKYMGSPIEQPVQPNDKYLPAYLQRNKKDKDA